MNNKRFSDNLKEDTWPLLEGNYRQWPRIKIKLAELCVLLTCVIIVTGFIGFLAYIDIHASLSRREVVLHTPYRYVQRSLWLARDPRGKVALPHPPPTHVIIFQTGTKTCNNTTECCQILHDLQAVHMDQYNFTDIAFNFMVGGDGKVYEGRGWSVQGEFAEHFDDKSLGIALIGTFDETAPPDIQLNEAKELIIKSFKSGKLSSHYTLLGNRQVSETDKSSQELYDIIRSWAHWKHCYMTSC
ncbi:peptidoglycan-recognition protein SD-like isoform X2 [Periplaneta americana]|uniref:peptidoglycan-recognition protein SD-like isoform X2 n=1 Tax=Periplaneta americana TaxID=6978 RepID=UPI0037E7A010